MEPDHPHALEFLKEDCLHVNDFFGRQRVAVLTVKDLFDFVTDPSITPENHDSALELYMQKAQLQAEKADTTELEQADAVFLNTDIPKKLEQVV